jgi:hypothetical protein
MVSGTNVNAVTSDYIYNGLGHLVGKNTPGVKQYIPDYTARVPAPLTDNGVKYVYGLGRVEQVSGGVAAVFHNDRLGWAAPNGSRI